MFELLKLSVDELLKELASTVELLIEAIEDESFLRTQGKDAAQSRIQADAKVRVLTERKFFIGRVLDARRQ